jgi:hypothetical protein
MGLGQTIALGARSLGLLRAAADNVDGRLKALEEEAATADPIRASVLREQIRVTLEERMASRELLHAAQASTDERAKAVQAREEAALADYGKIGSAARAAARRVDAALAEACAAIDEVEQLCEPLNNTLLPSGVLAKYTGSSTIMSAVRAAFASHSPERSRFRRTSRSRSRLTG